MMIDAASVSLNYGLSGHFACDFDAERPVAFHPPPPALKQIADAIRTALAQPLDFPPLSRAVVPGDRVVVALDRYTPADSQLVAGIWRVLQPQGVEAADLLILQPAAFEGSPLPDPRRGLPAELQSLAQWKIHDPTDESSLGYLATTAAGERIYLARDLLEADLVISVGQVAYDSILGYRGTNSVIYPGLSTTVALARAHGQGHDELSPDNDRPLRQLIDEVAWLLGTQFSLQVIAAGESGVTAVLAGLDHSVFRRGKELLSENWLVRTPERFGIVVVAVENDAAGHGWSQIGAALGTARNLVAKGGKVLVLSEVQAELETGMQLIHDSRNPRDALKPLRKLAPPDLIPATQLASLADWASVYFLSKMEGSVVEDLFMTPLETEQEARRLLAGTASCLLLGAAQHTFGRIGTDGTS
jgi:nickel-dependent lactate racemase